MTLPLRLLYIAVLQVVLTSIVTYWFVTNEYRELSNKNVQALEAFLIAQKQQELRNYTDIAMSSVDHLSQLFDETTAETKNKVADNLQRMLYNGDDGYFFIYDAQGIAIAHPKEPHRVGKNWWDLEDDNGEKIIQILLSNAQQGGGFYRYNWNKPSEQMKSEKMSHSVYINDWNWMFGTGVYLDDVYAQLGKIQSEIDTHLENTKHIILLVALSSIFLIFIFGFGITLSHKKKADAKISELAQRVIDVQEEENRHISRELHDGIIQILVSIKYALEATRMTMNKQQQDAPPMLAKAEDNLAVAMQEVRRISHHMHPQILDELGLSAAIASITQDFTKRTGVEVKVNKPALRKLLPDFINTTLYRVVQESLTNIQKHADAKLVVIDLSIESKWLRLEIKDDGKGFDTKQNCLGIGLRNLAERVQYHNGKFKVESSEKGTITEVQIPTASFVNHFNQYNLGSNDESISHS